jgi:uncharacterized Zn-finger protein
MLSNIVWELNPPTPRTYSSSHLSNLTMGNWIKNRCTLFCIRCTSQTVSHSLGVATELTPNASRASSALLRFGELATSSKFIVFPIFFALLRLATRQHFRKHTKPVQCPNTNCHMGFSTTRDLERHQHSRHAGEYGRRKVPCDMPGCGKRFSRKDHMLRHKKKAHFGQSGFH